MSTVLRIGTRGKSQTTISVPSTGAGHEDLDTRVALIQALIPLGLQAVEDVLQQEVQMLAGPRYARGDAVPHRCGGAGSAARSISPTRNSPSRCRGCVIGRLASSSRCRATPNSSSRAPRMRACFGACSTA